LSILLKFLMPSQDLSIEHCKTYWSSAISL